MLRSLYRQLSAHHSTAYHLCGHLVIYDMQVEKKKKKKTYACQTCCRN